LKSDPGFYDYWPYHNRRKIVWPNNAKVAFWVAPNIEYYELDPPANPYRKPWPRPYPDIGGYGIRDYGNRVGHDRQMRLLDKYGIRGSISLSTALCDHHPETKTRSKRSIRIPNKSALGTWPRPYPILKIPSIYLPKLVANCLLTTRAFIPVIYFTMTSRRRLIYAATNASSRFLTLWK